MIPVERMFAILDVLIEECGDETMAPMMKDTLLRALDKGMGARQLREAGREIQGMTRDMPQEWLDEVDRRAGPDDSPSLEKRAERILAAGRIESEEEWQDLSNFVDEIYADEEKRELLKRANALLAAYEISRAPRQD